MSDFSQKVLHLFKKSIQKIIPYALSLAASTNRRTYAGIARLLSVEYHELYDLIKSIDDYHAQIKSSLLLKVEKYRSRANLGWVIFDFTRLAKSKDAQTPMTTWDRDGRINKVNNGFSVGFYPWTNGFITIPLSFCLWMNKKDASYYYLSKKFLAKKALLAIKNRLGRIEVIVDGEFATLEMMEFFAENGIELYSSNSMQSQCYYC